MRAIIHKTKVFLFLYNINYEETESLREEKDRKIHLKFKRNERQWKNYNLLYEHEHKK